MAGSEDPSGLAALATETVGPIEQELRGRLVAEIGDGDVLAIESALLKAFLGGMQAGITETVESVMEQATPAEGIAGASASAPVSLERPPLPRLDPWADRYGAGG